MVERAWSWTRIDGRNVLAVPTQTEIRLYDSDDFILLSRLAPSGHHSPVAFVRWSAFHGRLASLSSTKILIHAPQRDLQTRSHVQFVAISCYHLNGMHVFIRGLAFSRNADELLYCGPQAGVGKLDVRSSSSNADEAPVLWKEDTEVCDVAKYSPSVFVFATLAMQQVRVWRMKRKLGEPDQNQTLYKVESLHHPDPVVYFSWKPSLTQWHSTLETDGTRTAQWFEPPRTLLTCTVRRSIRVWTETRNVFEPVLVFDPMHPLDNVRWVLSKNRNISDENFQVINERHDNQADWISGVDRHGILRLWRLVGIASSHTTVEETTLQIQVNGEDDKQNQGVGLGEACVMAYFSQNYFGMPSKLDIVLQRADHIMLSFHVAIGEGDRPSQLLKKSWYRSHLGSISALSAHPSLPLIASVDTYASYDGMRRNEVLVYWISFSAFSAESRLIPSGVLPCEDESGDVLCIQWVPTLHFDATPLLLVAHKSGVIDLYGRSARADVAVVSSPRVRLPKQQRKLARSPSLSPWTYYDYVTGEFGFEYEVACEKPTETEFGIQFERRKEKLIVARNCSSNKYLSEVSEDDELVALNNENVVGKDVTEVLALISDIPFEDFLLMRFRAVCAEDYNGKRNQERDNAISHQSVMLAPFRLGDGGDVVGHSAEEYASKLRRSFMSALTEENPQSPSSVDDVIHAGAVSMYGGWKQLLHLRVAPKLSLLCVCPSYADDGEYVPDSVLIFGIESLPGKLSVWKGVRNAADQSFGLSPLHIQGAAFRKKINITSLAGERDYRQRAFSSKRSSRNQNSLNSLLFVGDVAGNVEHWRCQLIDDNIQFTIMSSNLLGGTEFTPLPSAYPARESIGSFCRRGYVSTDQAKSYKGEDMKSAVAVGISHIEVDDPNRVAVLHADRPEDLHIFEAESGLGILRFEESISSSGRGNILGFTWCDSHVEFNVDALAVRYESALVIYNYDMTSHQWAQIGDDIVSPLPLFDCTRDSSALMIGGGQINYLRLGQNSLQLISNEMPVVIGKWDEPGSLLQHSMDWKAAESPQKLPVWHPYVLLTTMFGMHARVGEKDTSLAGDQVAYEFSRAFKDAAQMLKLLAKVLEHEPSARASASHGILSYTGPALSKKKDSGEEEDQMPNPIGRYSTSIHRSYQIDKAENLFAAPTSKFSKKSYSFGKEECCFDEGNDRTLASSEAATILAAVESISLCKKHGVRENALILFASFSEEHFLEMKALLHFVDAIQSLGFDLDASAADLGAKRFFAMNMFAKSLKSVVLAHTGGGTDKASSNPQIGEWEGSVEWRELHSEREKRFRPSKLEDTPSSGLLWALHSDAQQFLWEHCIQPQMQWNELRPLWLGLWVKDVKKLREIVERLAKLSYARSKDAMEVCLLYVAVGKEKVLSALANLTQSESNKTLASFLENDFSEKRWSNAAIRNAYSLLSKKKYEVAAAFFLLCNPPRIQDAIRVLALRLGDISLALVIARLMENQTNDKAQHDFTTSQTNITPIGKVTKQLLEQEVIIFFRQKCDVWLESCALWWLEEFEQAWTVLLPQYQDVDVCKGNDWTVFTQNDLLLIVARATHFFINLTSLTVYFQHLHSSVDSSLLSWARNKMHEKILADDTVSSAINFPKTRRLQLVSTADIEHAYSLVAYICKRSGLSDTALVGMLQARHLINLHARFEISRVEASDSASSMVVDDVHIQTAENPTSPRFQSSVNTWKQGLMLAVNAPSSARQSPLQGLSSTSQRRMSSLNESNVTLNHSRSRSRHRANSFSWYKELQSDKPPSTAPWLKAQIADIECRRWASSAFVGKMIGIRVAREMISYFRAELDMCFRNSECVNTFTHEKKVAAFCGQRHHHRMKVHKEFLDKLCTPLCEQFQVDRTYVHEAALAVMHPHAYLHIVEVCFLLSELGRASTLRKWVEYVSLSMLHSCSTFASCSIAEDVYRDWEGLTIQLCYILNLDAQCQISLPARVVAHIGVAVRTGIIFLSWARQRSDIVRQAVTLPFCSFRKVDKKPASETISSMSSFAFEMNLRLLSKLLRRSSTGTSEIHKTRIVEGNLGYTFLGAVATGQASENNISLLSWGGIGNAFNQNQFKIRKMYSLILMVSVLRTLHARATIFLSTFQGNVDTGNAGCLEADIASSLFTPQKLWKAMGDDPVEGLKRWYALIESHLRCEFDYSVKEEPCLCGLYGFDTAAFKAAIASNKWDELHCQADDIANAQKPVICDVNNENLPNGSSARHTTYHGTTAVEVVSNSEIEDGDPESLLTFLHSVGISMELHLALVNTSDDYVLLLMQNEKVGVRTTLRRFRLDPRVYVKSFVLRDAFSWFTRHNFFCQEYTEHDTINQIHAFLSRCCKQRKLRLLVTHRGEDAQIFPFDRHRAHSHDDSKAAANSVTSEHSLLRPRLTSDIESKMSETTILPEAFFSQSMMFVNPWEIEAEWNVRRYMHNFQSPLHVELGWDRLSPICSETCDEIVASVLEDSDLIAMWKATGGEGWLVTVITQYCTDGLHSYRTLHQHIQRGFADRDEPRIPFLVEIYSRSQRNAMFKVAGLPHRFVGVVTVNLIEAKDLIACSWLGNWSDAYVFLELCHANDNHLQTAEEWSLHTYRSPTGEGGVNPRWGVDENKYTFRFAIPIHAKHTSSTTGNSNNEGYIRKVDARASRLSSQVWNANINDLDRDAVDAFERLLSSVFAGPPTMLRCTVYQKNKVLSHQFMGRAKVSLNELTSRSPMDCWLPLKKHNERVAAPQNLVKIPAHVLIHGRTSTVKATELPYFCATNSSFGISSQKRTICIARVILRALTFYLSERVVQVSEAYHFKIQGVENVLIKIKCVLRERAGQQLQSVLTSLSMIYSHVAHSLEILSNQVMQYITLPSNAIFKHHNVDKRIYMYLHDEYTSINLEGSCTEHSHLAHLW